MIDDKTLDKMHRCADLLGPIAAIGVRNLIQEIRGREIEIRHLKRQVDAKYKMINNLCEDKKVLREALEYYADRDGGPYAPGDWHTVDGGKTACAALEKVKG